MNAQQLKNSILQEAIEGRLVKQDPNDEPASVLLDRIRKEKARLVKEGKLKKKDLVETPITEEEIPFEIPESWEWVRVRDVFMINPKVIADDNADAAFIPMEKIEACYGSKFSYLVRKWKDIKSSFTCFADGDVAFAKITPCFQNRKSMILRDLPNGIGAGTTELKVLRQYSETIVREYLLYFLASSYFIDEASFKGTANQQRIIVGYLENKPFPLPPLAEQKRIVEKIEQLLPKVEEYGKAQEALDKLNAELPERLKKSILQVAIEGRLVPQDPNDEPASVLLDRIRKEKARLVKEGKLKKKDLVETPITEEEIPFEIPESWEWVRIETVFNHSSGKQLRAGETEGILHEYITTSNLYWDRFELGNLKSMYFKDSELERCTAKKGDLLVCEGGDIGRSAIWCYDYDICLQNHIHRLRPYDNKYTKFIYYVMSFFKSVGFIGGKGIGIQGLSASALKSIIVPLPPLAEQKRIVEKIEQLLAEVDKLK